jgi:hypothetical protein
MMQYQSLESGEPVQFSPEERLILAISSPSRPSRRVTAAFAACQDWNGLLQLAQLHNLLPQLALLAGEPENCIRVPAQVAGQLEQVRMRALMLDRMQVLSLAEILQGYHDAGIGSMLLKGHSLAERLYADPCERISTDIDLVLPVAHRTAADAVMRGLGYHPVEPEFYDATHFHTPWINPQRRISSTIELHWELSPPSSPIQFEVDAWWEGARDFASRAGAVLIPPPDYELAHLAWHTFNKGTATLRDLSDLARLWAQATQTGKQAIDACCRKTGTTRFLHRALRLCRCFWGLVIGEAIGQEGLGNTRDWFAERLYSADAVLLNGNQRNASQRKIGYWSLLPSELAPWSFLISDTLQEVDDTARLQGQAPLLSESFSSLASILFELSRSITTQSARRE